MLTAEQRQLVTDNHNMIYDFCKQHGIDKNDYYDIFAISLCRAAQSFDPSKGFKFSTLAYRCMLNDFRVDFRAQNYPMRKPKGTVISLDETANGFEESLESFIGAETDLSNPTANDLVTRFKPKEKECLELRMSGATFRQICKVTGHSAMTVYRYFNSMKKKALAYMEG